MEAGRALDKLVAGRVMGWKTFEGEPSDGRPPHSPISLVLHPFPHYSTDIAAAWLVVEAMERRGFWAEMRTPFSVPFSPANDGYWCGYTPHGITGWNGTPDHHTQAATLPLAICLAALAACDVEVKE